MAADRKDARMASVYRVHEVLRVPGVPEVHSVLAFNL
jgi:hypothetical protein